MTLADLIGVAENRLKHLARQRETVAYFQAEAEANWLHTNEPEVWQATRLEAARHWIEKVPPP
jgi:hypothetical protein